MAVGGIRKLNDNGIISVPDLDRGRSGLVLPETAQLAVDLAAGRAA